MPSCKLCSKRKHKTYLNAEWVDASYTEAPKRATCGLHVKKKLSKMGFNEEITPSDVALRALKTDKSGGVLLRHQIVFDAKDLKRSFSVGLGGIRHFNTFV